MSRHNTNASIGCCSRKSEGDIGQVVGEGKPTNEIPNTSPAWERLLQVAQAQALTLELESHRPSDLK